MPRYNTQFILDIDDLELIEAALRSRKTELSLERLELLGDGQSVDDQGALDALDETLQATHELLGRLHNQKVFYRPNQIDSAPYIGG